MIEQLNNYGQENGRKIGRNAYVLIGPPTAGKTTAMSTLSNIYGVAVLRGRDVAQMSTIDAGTLRANRDIVPDDTFIPILRDELTKMETSNGVALENIPRSIPQAEYLVEWSRESGLNLNVINLHLEVGEVISRAEYRLECPCCGSTYHPTIKPSSVNGICDNDRNSLIKREGDNPETILKGYTRYINERDMIVGVLGQFGIIHNIEASGSIDQMLARMLSEIE